MYSPTVRQTSSIASAASWREVSTPRPNRVTVERRSTSETRPSATSATKSRVEFVPMSTTATRITSPRASYGQRGKPPRRSAAATATAGAPETPAPLLN